MTRFLDAGAILALFTMAAACTLDAEIAATETTGGTTGTGGDEGNSTGGTAGASAAGASTGGTATAGASSGGASTGGSGTTDPRALVRRLYPECVEYITENNPRVRNGIVSFDCGSSVDGPLWYLDLDTGKVISHCGGACQFPDEEQLRTCVMMCPPPAYGDCIAAQGSTASIPACEATSLCLASQVGVRSIEGEWECFGIDGSDTCEATDVQQFQYEDEHVRVQLNFNASIVGNYSTETLQAALIYWSAELKLPTMTQPIAGQPGDRADFVTIMSGEGREGFDTLEYRDGKLEVSFRYPVESVWFSTRSDHEDCVSDDIAGECACHYSPDTTARIWLDLPLQH